MKIETPKISYGLRTIHEQRGVRSRWLACGRDLINELES